MATPIPNRPSGYPVGPSDAPVQVDVFVDIECPFSRRGWGHIQAVRDAYAHQVRFTAHPIVLADHRQSWDLTKAATLIAAGDGARFWDFFSYLYDRQDQFSTAAFRHKTHADLYTLISKLVVDYAGSAEGSTFFQQMNAKENEQKAKVPIRYAISRGIWSTPTVLINGSEATDLSSASPLADWRAVLDPLLGKA